MHDLLLVLALTIVALWLSELIGGSILKSRKDLGAGSGEDLAAS